MNRNYCIILCIILSSLCTIFTPFTLNALVLEDLIENNKLHQTLRNKRVGYYIGSFDPLHKGHEAVAKQVVSENLCDYVVIYPSWGGDSFKQRADINLRLKMLFDTFKEHPKIIVTRLAPKQLQNALTTLENKPVVGTATKINVEIKPKLQLAKPIFEGLEFIGIIGSDTAMKLLPHNSSSLEFMSGTVIGSKHENHTWGGCIALPVSAFIIAMRSGDNISDIQNEIAGRPVINKLEIKEYDDVSSTSMKKRINNNQSIDHLVGPKVRQIIEKNNLYVLSY